MKKFLAAFAALFLVLGLAACSDQGVEEYNERIALNDLYDRDESLELSNLQEKRDREDDPSAVRYLYLMSYGQVVGYYVTVGKVSSSASQIAPETEFVRPCAGCERALVESPKDDGSYGQGDPGIFFFTSDGVMVETSLDYIQSDAPLAIDAPRLGG
jgi:hypothetical protein